MNEEKVREILEIVNSTITGKSSLHGKVERIDDEIREFSEMGNYILDRQIKSRGGLSGKIIIIIKRFFRKFTRWYVKPAFDHQNNINKQIRYIVKDQNILINNIIDELDKNKKELNDIKDQLQRTQHNVDDILKKYVSEISVNDINYLAFENKNRGEEEDISRRQEIYLEIFKGCENVLDIGCGRGEFVALLRDNNISAKGIDTSEKLVSHCQEKGLNVELADMFDYLKRQEDYSLGGIFCSQVVEHIVPNQILQLLYLANKKLKDNAPIILETINPENVVAVSNWFYMDPTHIRPVHPKTLEFMLEGCGYEVKEVKYLHPNENDKIPPLGLDETKDFDMKMEKVNEILFGPQDYACIAYKKQDIHLNEGRE